MGSRMGTRSQVNRGLIKGTPARIDRDRKAYELSLAGWTYEEIGNEFGVSHQTIKAAIKSYASTLVTPLAEDVRRQQLDRLELLWRQAYKKAEKGDVPAMNAALKVLERQAKLLGLDVNKIQIEGGTEDPRDIELIEMISEARAKMKAEEDRLREGTLPPK